MHGRDVDTELDDRARDLRRDTGEDRFRPEQANRGGRLDEVVGDLGVDDRHAGNVDDDALGLRLADLEKDTVHHLIRAMAVDRANERKKKDAIVNAYDRCGELANRG